MPQVAYIGSLINCPPGAVAPLKLGMSSTVFVNGIPVAVANKMTGSKITPHNPPNPLCAAATIILGIPTVFVGDEFTNIATVGSLCSCGHIVDMGSPNVYAGAV